MPPRYAYWTILVDDQATAFRAGSQEDLMPTFKRLKEKHPSATMMWFQNGKLWPSRIDAQEAMRARGEMGRRGDERQGGFRDRERRPSDRSVRDSNAGANFPARRSFREGGSSSAGERSEKPEWRPKSQAPRPKPAEKLDWKPKGEFTPAPKRAERPDWKPKSASPQDRKPARPYDREKPDWKPKGSFDRETKPAWKPKRSFDRDRKPDWKPKGSYGSKPAGRREWTPRDEKPRSNVTEKLEWKPKGFAAEGREGRSSRPARESGPQVRRPASAPEKRKWVPKEEYKKSLGIEAKRDSKWRPGGEHRDPRQKYKDAKKAKWTKFKKNIRQKWEKKPGKKKP
jgi:hypothetical protein